MNLADYQRTFARICLSRKADPADVAAIGGELERWLMYRRMVRKRLRRVTGEGLPRTTALLGESYRSLYTEFLAERGVESRYMRDAIPEFCEFLFDRAESLGRRVEDIARYEHARWMVRDAPDFTFEGLVDFDFDKPPAVNPARRFIGVRHPVWDRGRFEAGERLGSECALAVIRTSELKVTAFTMPDWFVAILGTTDGQRTVTEIVHSLADRGDIKVDAGFVERLCDVTAHAIEKDLLLGSIA